MLELGVIADDLTGGAKVASLLELLKRGLATDAGSGIPRLIQLVREQTGRAPTLRLAGDEFVVTLPRTANEPDYTAESQVRRQRG